MVKVTVSGVTKEYETGITYGEVSKDFKDNCKYDIILAKQGAKLIELNKKIKTDCEIEFLDISDPNGHKTYVRGVNLLLLDAFYEVCKDMPLKNVFIKYMIGDSCYCEAEGIEITDEILKKVEEKMHELVKKAPNIIYIFLLQYHSFTKNTRCMIKRNCLSIGECQRQISIHLTVLRITITAICHQAADYLNISR